MIKSKLTYIVFGISIRRFDLKRKRIPSTYKLYRIIYVYKMTLLHIDGILKNCIKSL